ncbi:MAG: isopenicillin N synthase-like dioxygenase [Planctomycetota bacterium]|jgi:isopenicillin N synthase-like dioxygenase
MLLLWIALGLVLVRMSRLSPFEYVDETMTGESKDSKRQRGILASSAEFTRYDQVNKPDYHLAESADGADVFDEDFEFATCDLGRFLHGDAGDKRKFADELGEAMRDIGFAILEGHGVDPELFKQADGWVEQLFTTTDLKDKMRFRAARHGAVSEGYFPLEETSDIHPDQVEGWVFGRRAFDLPGNEQPFDAATLWPRPEFEPKFRQLVQAEGALIQPIMRSILMGLGLDPNLFDERLHNPHLASRLNYYPPLDQAAPANASRLLGHEDVDLFTLLPAPSIEGLQALKRDGRWARLSPPAGTIILNTGDYLQRLSNDILPSTTHRVGRPRDASLHQRPRVSFPLAAYLRPNEILKVLPGTGTPKYDPIKVITFHTRTTAKFYGDNYAIE